MPIVTLPPIKIDSTNFSRQSSTEIGPFVFKVGSDVYQVLANFQTGSPRQIRIYLSTDSGTTWTEQDIANSPNNSSGALVAFQDPATSNLWVCYIDPAAGGGYRVVSFDVTTKTYGAFSAKSTTTNASFFYYRKSNGDSVVVWCDGVHLRYDLLSAGVWSGPVNLAAVTVTVYNGKLLSTGVCYLGTVTVGGQVGIYRLSSTFVLSGPDNLGTNDFSNSSTTMDLETFGSSSIAISYISSVSGAIVYIGTPLAAPVFTPATVYAPTGSQSLSYPTLLEDNAGLLRLYYAKYDYGVSPIVDEWDFSIFNGTTWGAPSVFYDETANPPTDSVVATSQFVHTFGIVQLPSTALVAGTAMELEPTTHVFCTGFALISGVASGTLTLIKVVSSGPVLPSTWNLSAVGPATLSGPGPSVTGSVPAGTYALSESIVAGFVARGFVCTGGTQVGQNITIAAGDTVVCTIINDPIVISAGGRAFVKLTLNFFNACLGREYLLYQLINRELLKCGIKPACFCIDERDWGGNFSEHEEVPMGPPEGAIAFNPTGQIVMPTVASGDNTIFQFRVPIGYDGVILGQYHQYIQPLTAFPPPIFVEGSGDLVWRLEVAGRFVRDCGSMLVSLGSLQNMSPIAGGLQVRSGNIIRYVVAAPNTTGALMAGVGNIVAGLHGWMWPRH